MNQEQEFLGRPVASMQQMLRTLHFDDSRRPFQEVTGEFDAETQRALKAFQQEAGLPETGEADNDTWDALVQSYYKAEQHLAAAEPLCVIIQRGGCVQPGQTHLHLYPYQAILCALAELLEMPAITVNGCNDEACQTATKWLQERALLPVTGVIDKATWDAASRLYPAILGDGSLEEG